MVVEIKIPDFSVTLETVVLLKWLKQEGDSIKRGDALCEVETDKAVTELESVAQGTLLKQAVPENTEITVGTIVAYIGDPDDEVPQ